MSARLAGEFTRVVNARQMLPGQIGLMTYGDEKILVLRTYEQIVDLNRPIRTWSPDTNTLDIEVLPEGTMVELRAETIR